MKYFDEIKGWKLKLCLIIQISVVIAQNSSFMMKTYFNLVSVKNNKIIGKWKLRYWTFSSGEGGSFEKTRLASWPS